ncbi:MAG: phospholipase D-nuclease [uncultured archaeon A07HR67]|nr:MAG: phospholipase D-nuclease [uncultured archaeon A07HR67]
MLASTLLQGGIAGVVSLLVALLMFAAHVAMIVWTYSDAQTHSDQPAFLWAIVVFLAPLLGIVLYFLLGR